jgi:hypothetical protein
MLEPGHRYRCAACGNLTRFDEVASRRTRRFLHFDLGGAMKVEEEEILSEDETKISCRWCGSADSIEQVPLLSDGE